MSEVVNKEMTSSLNEFFRLIPKALIDVDYVISDNKVTFAYEGGQICIDPGKEQVKQIASLKMPLLYVNFQFDAISEENTTLFLNHFLKVYQRGGG